ncbi:MAG: hypothetical protein VKL60_10080 [Sphaerospermopsis sp.]|nr:hypothetical protein [Sphaerospermopsis sp.]
MKRVLLLYGFRRAIALISSEDIYDRRADFFPNGVGEILNSTHSTITQLILSEGMQYIPTEAML